MADKTFAGGIPFGAEKAKDMGDGTFARVMAVVSPDGTGFNDKKQYVLLSGVNAQGAGPQVGPITGGDYLWRVTATAWNGATATLQFLDLDGATWSNVRNAANTADVTLTANGSVAIGIAQGSILRVNVTGGTPSNMNSQVAGL